MHGVAETGMYKHYCICTLIYMASRVGQIVRRLVPTQAFCDGTMVFKSNPLILYMYVS